MVAPLRTLGLLVSAFWQGLEDFGVQEGYRVNLERQVGFLPWLSMKSGQTA